jgi:RHS repeat-associated protein
LLIDVATGAIAGTMNHDEYGRVTQDTLSSQIPFGYAGGHYDSQTGLVRFGVRDYDAETGRWTTKDPIGFGGGHNLYGYVHADPINHLDPLGLEGPPPGPPGLPGFGIATGQWNLIKGIGNFGSGVNSLNQGRIGEGNVDVVVGSTQIVMGGSTIAAGALPTSTFAASTVGTATVPFAGALGISFGAGGAVWLAQDSIKKSLRGEHFLTDWDVAREFWTHAPRRFWNWLTSPCPPNTPSTVRYEYPRPGSRSLF